MLKALIVDDDPSVIRCFENLIKWNELGYEKVYVALNGVQAYEIAKNNNIDVIISDLKMPNMSGIELARKLRDEKINLEIILLTAYEDFSAAREGIELKFFDYLLKPIEIETIERLSDNLQRIAKKRNNIRWVKSLTQGIFDKEIMTAFTEGNLSYFEILLKKIGTIGDEKEENQIFQMAVGKMISVFCRSLGSLNFSDESIKVFRTKLVNATQSIDSHMEISEFLLNEFREILATKNKNEGRGSLQEKITEIKKFIYENCGNPGFSVADISKVFYYSQDHINRMFKKSEGITANNFINVSRMEKAKKLLLETDMDVGKVAKEVGYNSTSYFTSSFKNFYGITPTLIREKNRKISRDSNTILK